MKHACRRRLRMRFRPSVQWDLGIDLSPNAIFVQGSLWSSSFNFPLPGEYVVKGLATALWELR